MPASILTADFSDFDQRMEVFSWVLNPIRVLMENVKFAPKQEFINPYILTDVLVHCQKDLKKFTGPDAFKIGGHICYWLAKLKPFRAITEDTIYANESMALRMGLCVVWEGHGRRSLDHKIQANMLYNLRYGHNSPITISNQFQLLYCDPNRVR